MLLPSLFVVDVKPLDQLQIVLADVIAMVEDVKPPRLCVLLADGIAISG